MSLIEHFNPGGTAPVLVVCDHAGRVVPDGIDLGIDDDQLARHIGWDIGAGDLSRRLALRLAAPAILNHCSRLVIDGNRRPHIATSIPPISDGCVVPGNVELDPAAVAGRITRYWLPYHRTVARALAAFRRRGVVPAVIAIHSCTPVLAGQSRPWHVGVLWRGDRRIAGPVLEALRAIDGLVVGDNEPYSGLAEFGYTIEFHGQRTGLPHVMLEIRQDEIATRDAAERWADLCAEVLQPTLRSADLYRVLERSPETVTWRRSSLTASH